MYGVGDGERVKRASPGPREGPDATCSGAVVPTGIPPPPGSGSSGDGPGVTPREGLWPCAEPHRLLDRVLVLTQPGAAARRRQAPGRRGPRVLAPPRSQAHLHPLASGPLLLYVFLCLFFFFFLPEPTFLLLCPRPLQTSPFPKSHQGIRMEAWTCQAGPGEH